MKRVEDKVAIVTGAALGIGQATSALLAQEGAKVAVTDVQVGKGKELVRRIADTGGVAEFWRMDVTRESDVKRVFRQIHKRFGRVDVLVNNAGIVGVNKPTHEITETQWDAVQAVNVKGVFFCTKHVIPYLREAGGGSIVNISSIYGIIGAPDLPSYHASKAAVRVMTKTDAMLYATDGIRINSIHPGYIWTPLVEGMAKQSPEGVEAFRKHLDSLHPVGHVGEANDVAYGILYLSSDESKFVTGRVLGGEPGTERLMEYEAKLNYFFPENDALAICQYNRNRFSPKVIKDVISTHPFVICGGVVCNNFYYIPPDDFLVEEQPDKEIDRLLDNIVNREKVEEELQRYQERLEELFEERTAELGRMNERYLLATSAAGLGVWDWYIEKNELIWDERMYGLYGITKDAFGSAYEAWLNGVHPDDRARSNEISKLARLGEREYDTEFRVVWPDGSIHCLKAYGQIVRAADGRPSRMTGVNFDITEHKEAEGLLHGQKRVLELVASGAPLPESLTALVRLIEAHAPGMLGSILLLDEEGIHLRHGAAPSLPQEYTAAIDGVTIGPNVGSCGTAAYCREAVFVEDIATDPLWNNYKGVALPHGLRACWSTPIFDAQQRVLGTFAMYYRQPALPQPDHRRLIEIATHTAAIIIGHDRIGTALRESELKYRLLVANAGEAIFVIQDGLVTFPNAKALELTGYSAEELVETPFTQLIHPEDRSMVVERYMQQAGGGGPAETPRFRIVKKNSRHAWTQLTTAEFNWEGRPGTLCFLRDITEELKLEAHTLQSQKMEAVGHLAGGVAHDFNNLLQVILGYVDLVIGRLGSQTAESEALGMVRQAAERAADLTEQLLAFGRRQIIQPVILDVNDLVQGVLKMIRRVIGEHIELCYMPGDRLGMIHADKGQLEQVLMNLCVNARDAMPTGGTLTIETENVVIDEDYCREHPWAAAGRFVMLVVTDTGEGMDEATRARIFEPFFTTKGVGKGTGLGLATVYGILKQHNSLINVYSEPGKGTAFKIYIPFDERRPDVLKLKIEPRAVGGTETILVAEDEDGVRNLVSNTLKTAGYTVLTACDGEDALRVFEEHADAIDLALLDVMMPKLGGRAVMDRIQTKRPEMRFLFCSGYSQNALDTNFVVQDGLRLVTKPYGNAQLLRAVRETLDAPRECNFE